MGLLVEDDFMKACEFNLPYLVGKLFDSCDSNIIIDGMNIAISKGNLEVVKLLLSCGVSLSCVSESSFYVCVFGNNLKTVEFVFNNGFKNVGDCYAFNVAIKESSGEMLKILNNYALNF